MGNHLENYTRKYMQPLTEIMHNDFVDWHRTDIKNWPSVAAGIIKDAAQVSVKPLDFKQVKVNTVDFNAQWLASAGGCILSIKRTGDSFKFSLNGQTIGEAESLETAEIMANDYFADMILSCLA